MSISTLPKPPGLSASCDSSEEDIPPDQLGQYSVNDRRFLRRAAEDLMSRCEQHRVAIADSVIAVLQLSADERSQDGMFRALLRIKNIAERRWAVCQMVHEIVRLK